MHTNNVSIDDFNKFPGGWSLSPYTIYLAYKYCTYNNRINILEFGSGEGTNQLVSFFKKNNISFNYTTVEHNKNFLQIPEVNYIYYNLLNDSFQHDVSDEINHLNLTFSEIYDLIIIDGPHGKGRKAWYKKIINNVRSGTIILIDDFHHFLEFSIELDNTFKYTTINEFCHDCRFVKTPINSGKETVNTSLPGIYNKTHKIIKIL